MSRPQTWNRYTYARDNPLKFVDPTGEIVEFANDNSKSTYAAYKDGLGFDGSKVQLYVDAGGPSSEMSLSSRMAHEIRHGIQVDNGDIGFAKKDDKWVAIFNDINDEVGAWNAGVRQATGRDLARGPLGDYNRADNKANHLMKNGYARYRGKGSKPVKAPLVPGFAPGSVIHTPAVFYRIPV